MTAMDCYSSMYWLSPGTRVSYALSSGRLSAPDARCCCCLPLALPSCCPFRPLRASASLPFAPWPDLHLLIKRDTVHDGDAGRRTQADGQVNRRKRRQTRRTVAQLHWPARQRAEEATILPLRRQQRADRTG